MKKRRVWLSYDLGIPADYPGLYSFLDNWRAKECGSSIATFLYEYESDIFGSMKAELESLVELGKRSRIYVVTRDDEGKLRGKFLAGKRKGQPWAGYGTTDVQEDLDEEFLD